MKLLNVQSEKANPVHLSSYSPRFKLFARVSVPKDIGVQFLQSQATDTDLSF